MQQGLVDTLILVVSTRIIVPDLVLSEIYLEWPIVSKKGGGFLASNPRLIG